MTELNIEERIKALLEKIENTDKRMDRLNELLDAKQEAAERKEKPQRSKNKKKSNKREKEASGSKAIGKTIRVGDGKARIIDYETKEKSFVAEAKGSLITKGETMENGAQFYLSPTFVNRRVNE